MRYLNWLLLPFLITSCMVRERIPSEIAAIQEKEWAPKRDEIILIDAGHGGKDSGTLSSLYDYKEKELTLATAKQLDECLKKLGYRTLMTRHNDTYIPLKTRAEIANEERVDLFVSVHYNFCPSEDVKGVEIYYYKENKHPNSERVKESRKLGELVGSHIVTKTGAHIRGVKQGNFCVIRETEMPAILVEGGFLSNHKERAKLKDPKYQEELAWGIAKGIDHYLEKQRDNQ